MLTSRTAILAARRGHEAMKLNLGCGNLDKPGFVGVDRHPCAAARVLCNLSTRLPFREDSVEEVWIDNAIEHVPDTTLFMSEIARICRHGAKVTVRTPHFSSQASWRDPTHLHHFSYFTMDHFEKASARHYTGGGFRVTGRRLSFAGGPLGWIGRMIFGISPATWEKQFCFVFRGSTLTFELAVVKGPDPE
jgi:SAM-dependent methyltransferase